jgi:NitT/TauT family transport system permease protein
MRGNALARIVLPPLIVCAGVVLILEILVRLLKIQPFLLPAPSAVAAALNKYRDELAVSLWTTTKASLIGFFASAIIGILVAITLAASPIVRRAFYPYAVFFQTVPIVAIAPLLVIWFDAGLASVAISAFIVSVFPVIANTLSGLLSTDPALEDLFRLYGASAWARLFKLRLPWALPNIITGLRIAAGLAVIGTVVAEFLVGELGAEEGVGVRIIAAKRLGRTDEVFAAVLVASLLGLVMFAAINLAGKLLLKNWHASEQE